MNAATTITALADLPPAHWKKIRSANPLEWLNREVERRADGHQVFPDPAALDRLLAMVLAELHAPPHRGRPRWPRTRPSRRGGAHIHAR